MPIELTEMAVSSAKSCWTIDFYQYRKNDVCPVMTSFSSEMTHLTIMY